MGTENTPAAPHPPKLLDQVRDKIRSNITVSAPKRNIFNG